MGVKSITDVGCFLLVFRGIVEALLVDILILIFRGTLLWESRNSSQALTLNDDALHILRSGCIHHLQSLLRGGIAISRKMVLSRVPSPLLLWLGGWFIDFIPLDETEQSVYFVVDGGDIAHPHVETAIPSVFPLPLAPSLLTSSLLPTLLSVTALPPRKQRVGSFLEGCPGGRFGYVSLVGCSMGSALHARAIIQLYY